ncbi:MAG: hypothetical protein DMG05_00615 [Acidobacteria bacterium]|nr:MAG: hypothetical protein DMG05_00615 [Acidobacteriota bacterium]
MNNLTELSSKCQIVPSPRIQLSTDVIQNGSHALHPLHQKKVETNLDGWSSYLMRRNCVFE